MVKIDPTIAATYIRIFPEQSLNRYLKMQFYGCLRSGMCSNLCLAIHSVPVIVPLNFLIFKLFFIVVKLAWVHFILCLCQTQTRRPNLAHNIIMIGPQDHIKYSRGALQFILYFSFRIQLLMWYQDLVVPDSVFKQS